jgi:hypothetical protein
MPLMPEREEHPLPLARAQARLAFDTLLRDRMNALASGETEGDGSEEALDRGAEAARLLESLGSAFADAVDRENSTRGILRAGVAVDYVDAVVLTGDAGVLVVDAVEYNGAPAYWQTKARNPDLVIRGRDLDAYLRTGETRYAEQLGIA